MLKMIKRVTQMIKMAYVSAVGPDTSAYPQGQASYNGKTTNFLRLSPYGLFSNPPSKSVVLLLSSQAQESFKFGISDDMLNRFKGLKEGECGLYNTLTKAFVHLKEDGTIAVYSPNNVEVNADVDVNVVAAGNVSVQAGVDVDVQAGGDVSVVASGDVNITGTNINLTGNVAVTGTLQTTGLTTLDDANINGILYSTHRHNGVQTGSGNTGGPL